MPPRALALAAGAIVLAAIVFFIGLRFLGGEPAGPVRAAAQPAPAAGILVAARPLSPGARIAEGDLAFRPWPAAGRDPGYVAQGTQPLAAFTGRVVRVALLSGDPITPARLAAPADRGALALVAGAGLRAVSVALSPATGVSGLVTPGDRVDVLLTHALPRHPDENWDRRVALTVLRDRRVLAIDQLLGAPADGAPAAPIDLRTATLEVTAREAEALALAGELGRLSLSVRALARSGGVEPEPATLRDWQVSPLLAAVPRLPRTPVAGAPAAPRGDPGARRSGVALFRGSSATALETGR